MPEDDQVVGDLFQFGDHVRGEHGRDLVRGNCLPHRLREVGAREGVEGGERLVEHQELGPAGQRDRERELCFLSAGQRPDPLLQRNAQTVQPGDGPVLVPPHVQVPADPEHVPDRQVLVQGRVLGHEGGQVPGRA